jgi:excisionase family DNA binding protein
MSELPRLARLAASVKHSADLLDVSVWQVWRLIRDGEVETFRVGRKRLVTYESLQAFVAKKMSTTKESPGGQAGANEESNAHTANISN